MTLLRPVFIVAPPRSGATLLYEILSSVSEFSPLCDAPEVVAAALPPSQESHRLTAAALTPEAAATIKAAHEQRLHHRDQRLLEKSEHNALRVPFLAGLFPDAQFVCVLRDPRFALPAMLDSWRRGAFITERELPGWPEKPWSMALVPGWRELAGRPPAEVVARQWTATTSILLDDLGELERGRWIAVDYSRLVSMPLEEMARVCGFLGVPMPPPRALPGPDEGVLPEEIEPYIGLTADVATRIEGVLAEPQSVPPVSTPPWNDPDSYRGVASQSFAEILHDHGISIVATTYQSGRVVFLRAPDRKTLNTHFRSLPSPMGVAVRRDALAIGTKQEVVEFRNQPKVAERLDPPNVNDVVWMPAHVQVTGDIRIHEMGWAGGELWAVNTLFSTLCTIERGHSFVPRWRPPFVTMLAAEDRCHLNGIAFDGDGASYVTALGETDTPSGWRADKRTGGVVIDVRNGRTVVRGLSMPHSPRLYAGRLWLLESGRGTLVAADPVSGEVETIAEMPGFTRGLAFAGPFAFIGLSQVRESNVFGGIPLVERVKDRQCGISVVDLRSREIVAFLRFEGVVQEIFDVQVLPGVRYPDLLELNDERVATSYVVPEEAIAAFCVA